MFDFELILEMDGERILRIYLSTFGLTLARFDRETMTGNTLIL